MASFFISLWNSRVRCNLDWNVFVLIDEHSFPKFTINRDFLSLCHVGNMKPQMSVNSDVNGSDEGREIQAKKE